MPSVVQTRGFKNVIIVGAGPSGLLLALMLAKKGIPVVILESAPGLDKQPRATHYASPAIHELIRAGVMDDVRAAGFHPDSVVWRKLDGTVLAGLDATIFEGEPDRMTCLPLDKLGAILYRHLEKQETARVEWGSKVMDIGQDEDKAWVEVEKADGRKRFEADYVVGCDGANSQVRRCLFGKSFPGKTWDEQIVATNTYYDFQKYGYNDSNFFIHPEHWHMVARISNDGLWRVTYGEIPGLTKEELSERLPSKFKAMFPGHPDPEEYRVVNFSPYKVHQRLAEKLRVGRFLLAADAAHLCNPFGGLGLTGGIVDIGGLYDCLIGIYEERTDPSILDKYSEIRSKIYKEIIDPVSSENIRRLFDQDPDAALDNDEFLKMCKRTATDLDYSRELQLGVNGIKYDFTKEYTKEQ
ncbi:hypothetical protein IFR04_008119 [Cadophora malorum]|uniref:FAD-binding domain-containing protein n=1 Tax=Cadophora malorum TaxID=108018 RepID=A0A8H7TGF0_9HELO|nr:hypothetical protein IFR04_008119 [Cadophora malorum]